jgi:hypothetical protein
MGHKPAHALQKAIGDSAESVPVAAVYCHFCSGTLEAVHYAVLPQILIANRP